MNSNYFIIPGNPPALHFYELWCKEMLQNGAASARVSHYPSMSFQTDSQSAMDGILESHSEQLKKFQNEVKGEVSIVGHSLGAYFALKLLEKSQDKIERVIMLHPFLRAPSFRGKAILYMVGTLHSQKVLQKLIISSRKGLEFFSRDLPFVTNDEILKSFHLARHESRTIGPDKSPLKINQKLKGKIQVFFTKKDDWCGAEVIGQLENHVEVRECTEPHGFITNKNHRLTLLNRFEIVDYTDSRIQPPT